MNKEIERFFGNSIKRTINGQEFEFKPLRGKHLGLSLDLGSKDDNIRKEAMEKVVRMYLKELLQGVTDAQIDEMDVKYLGEFFVAILEANGLDKSKIDSLKEIPKEK